MIKFFRHILNTAIARKETVVISVDCGNTKENTNEHSY